MDKRKLIVWEIIRDIEGELHYKELKLSKGLSIVFEDDGGNEYSIVYDKLINGMYVWSCRFTGEHARDDLISLERQARKDYFRTENQSYFTYKMVNSDYLEWYDSLPTDGSDLHPYVEHHVYITSEQIFEVLCEYEPKLVFETTPRVAREFKIESER